MVVQSCVVVFGPPDDSQEVGMIDCGDNSVAAAVGFVDANQHRWMAVDDQMVGLNPELVPDQHGVSMHFTHQPQLLFDGVDLRWIAVEQLCPLDHR